MGKNTLNQYISNYTEAVLKLKDIDEFQKIMGFVRGLKYTYKVKVRSNSPKTFEEAIKFAQIYDDTTGKSKTRIGEQTSFQPRFPKFSGFKRKVPFKQETLPEIPKKIQTQRYPLLKKEDYEKAKQEKLCF